MSEQTDDTLLRVEGLKTEIEVDGRWVPIVDDVSYSVKKGQTLGLVGESGSGKSVSAMTLMGFMGRQPGQRMSGLAEFRGRNLLELSEREMQDLRGGEIAMIFQEPMTSLDPAFKVGQQIAAGVRLHQGVSRAEAKRIAIEAMEKVRIPNAKARAESYPHEFSGGMRQRVLIAMALANNPSLLIADEPTTALDVSVQAQILTLLKDMQRELGLAVIFITHNMGVVADMCDELAVMYAGQIVEKSDVYSAFAESSHPYTAGLLSAMPSLKASEGKLAWIPGSPPKPVDFVAGCRFADRCAFRQPGCDAPTTLHQVGPGHSNRCSRGIEWKHEAHA